MNNNQTTRLLIPSLSAVLAMAAPEVGRADEPTHGAAQPPAEASPEASQGETAEAPFIASPEYVVERMLELGEVGTGDYVVDLGSGDGRIVIAAAQRGAYGLGVEIERELVLESRERAAEGGVADRVMFLEQDLFDTDISQASVVTMYLLQSLNLKLRPRLLEELRPGTRVVSHDYHMGDWEPDARERLGKSEALPWSRVYAWVVPADVAGHWSWRVGDRWFDWRVAQRFQKLSTRLQAGGTDATPEDVELNGRRVGLTTEHEEVEYVFSGRAEGDRIEGYVQVSSDDRRSVRRWSAERH